MPYHNQQGLLKKRNDAPFRNIRTAPMRKWQRSKKEIEEKDRTVNEWEDIGQWESETSGFNLSGLMGQRMA